MMLFYRFLSLFQPQHCFWLGNLIPCGYREAYQIRDNYPRATFAILDRAGYALSYEQNGVFLALVGEWMDRVEEYIGQKPLGK